MIKEKSAAFGQLIGCSRLAIGLALTSGVLFSAPAFAAGDAVPAGTSVAAS